MADETDRVFDPHNQSGELARLAGADLAVDPGHPRRELELDAEALDRVALIAHDYGSLAENGNPTADPPVLPNPAEAKRIYGEEQILRNWAEECRRGKTRVPHQ